MFLSRSNNLIVKASEEVYIYRFLVIGSLLDSHSWRAEEGGGDPLLDGS